jgi:hypothetical protein
MPAAPLGMPSWQCQNASAQSPSAHGPMRSLHRALGIRLVNAECSRFLQRLRQAAGAGSVDFDCHKNTSLQMRLDCNRACNRWFATQFQRAPTAELERLVISRRFGMAGIQCFVGTHPTSRSDRTPPATSSRTKSGLARDRWHFGICQCARAGVAARQ